MSNTMPRTVVALGMVSLFMDLSSEIIHALLPLFLTTTLGVSVAMVGLIDGVAEATASLSKIISGYVSDRVGRRKPLILFGYGLSALTKPLFALAHGAGLVMVARFADRVGKGLRGAPRDALIADVTPPAIRGRAFGLRQALDTAGAFIGPLLAIGLLLLTGNDLRLLFWIAAIPAVISALIVLIWVREPAGHAASKATAPLTLRGLGHYGRAFWAVVGIGVLFTLARFSESFLVLKASASGLPLALAPLVLVAMNLVYTLGAYPVGMLADRMPARHLLRAGLVCLILADVLLGHGASLWTDFAGIALWGAHLALTQGVLAKLVADRAPENLRGTAFGLFNLATGLTMLVASPVAGLLWVGFGPAATFAAGGLFALLALALTLLPARLRTAPPATPSPLGRPRDGL